MVILMTEKQYRTNDIVEFDYSEIWEKSNNEMYTDKPLRNDEVVKLLNKQYKDICFHIEINNKLQEAIGELKQENEQLKQQLLYDGNDVCSICKHQYLVPSGDYFIGMCKKGHKECSKGDIKYCEDFE